MSDYDVPGFGDLVRQSRLAARLTQEELAARAGLSARGISDLERGLIRTPRRDTLALLADALDLPDEERQRWDDLRRRLSARITDDPPPGDGQLPRPLTSFVGRERERVAVAGLLGRPDVRLLTLTGPGGVGKTRLSLAIGEELNDRFHNGIRFVPLAPVSDHRNVVPAIAAALDIADQSGLSLIDVVANRIGERELLLLLDNFEHVIEASTEIAHLLARCVNLRVLATSRSPLRIGGEHEYPVPPLEVPGEDSQPSLDRIAGVDAVELFVQRARTIQPGFALTGNNAEVVAGICRKLDGLPLAIELAATRTRTFPLHELSERLDQPLAILTGGPRDAAARQQTLRNTIAWSYDLLNDDEQRLFRRLAVFRGGWTLDAAEAVAGGDLDVLAWLDTLIEHSLVQLRAINDGEYRYGILETIREFGLERLAGHGEDQRIRERHAGYFTELAEQAADAMLNGIDQKQWLAQLESDHANLQAAFDWSVDACHAVLASRIAVALEEFWYSRGHGDEARRWLRDVVELDDGVPVELRANVYKALGRHLRENGQYDEAETLHRQAIALYREMDDFEGLAEAYMSYGDIAMYRGDYDRAVGLYEQGLSLARQAENTHWIIHNLAGLAIMASIDADLDRAGALAMECLELSRESGDQQDAAMALVFLGHIALWQGDLGAAEDWVEQGIAGARDVGDFGWLALAKELKGHIELEREEFARAHEFLCEGLRDMWQAGELMICAQCIEGLAGAATGLGRHDHAARLLGAAASLRETIGSPIHPPRQERYDRTVTCVRKGLGSDTAFETAMAEGRAWSLDQAVSAALEPLEVVEPEAPELLTPRELEVLKLLVDGRSNQEIAGALFISPHTAIRHVANIMNKLGVESRTAAATWAVRQGIV